ncbi:MAG: Membrane bound hydrogenase subunit mbhE [Methanomicrobiales archaeon 53_19]|jgi:multisubunit Na+/H+ antiporter MnhB subunit|uniref:hydrogen gas-evolving membrane-bound hydrogenase subunit E n=1 Tax=Methanocalculus sp. TaxID=2004547 RepID=UPI000747B8C3|nr:hydrogen gas-evolving membrane-bound hydrogenase subunit E [Methanocalculus sp.]KUK70650.1 MAG: Membrane bound hydrogenase subunit mbhE [Methanocalculus sp. 52_23]KUL03267.1 MAG: Membrane bound hydrogenase subunit mbhE [Methanomicrobiales archaeon 53_19]HIJ07272.1 hypothetical protein [Methanocalculus sp.]
MKRKLSIIITILMIGMLGVIVSGLTFGDPVDHPMDRYFIENSQEESGANNVVTAVLFDYRGFDTLGEAAVLFTAALGASLIFRKRRDD